MDKTIHGYQQIISKKELPADIKFEYDFYWDGYKLAIFADSEEDIITTLHRLSIKFDVMAQEIIERRKAIERKQGALDKL